MGDGNTTGRGRKIMRNVIIAVAVVVVLGLQAWAMQNLLGTDEAQEENLSTGVVAQRDPSDRTQTRRNESGSARPVTN